MVKVYSEKPQMIDAIQWTGENLKEIKEFTGKAFIMKAEDDVVVRTFIGYKTLHKYDYMGKKDDKLLVFGRDLFESIYERYYPPVKDEDKKTVQPLTLQEKEEFWLDK